MNWVGFGMWKLNGDAMRLWVLAWVLLLIPDRLSVAGLVLFERPARDWIAKLGKRPAS
jgi:hypothetical protein